MCSTRCRSMSLASMPRSLRLGGLSPRATRARRAALLAVDRGRRRRGAADTMRTSAGGASSRLIELGVPADAPRSGGAAPTRACSVSTRVHPRLCFLRGRSNPLFISGLSGYSFDCQPKLPAVTVCESALRVTRSFLDFRRSAAGVASTLARSFRRLLACRSLFRPCPQSSVRRGYLQ